VKKILHPAFFLFGALVFLLIAPPVLGTLKADILVGFGIACLFAVSLNLLFETGLFSLGHALFFGTGGYITALGLFYIEGLPLIPAILLGGSAAGLVGLLFSPLLLRASGIYFTLLTVALNQILYTTCLKFSEITGGETGFSNYLIPPLDLFGLASFPMDNKINFYYFALVTIILCIWIMWFITRTPFGSIMLAIRDNPRRVPYLGYWMQGNKILVFVISGFFAGIAGALNALWLNLVDPSSLHLVNVSFKTFLAILVGGLGTFSGPFIGVGIFLLFGELVVNYGRTAEMAILGITIVYLLYAPKYTPWGIIGIYLKIRQKLPGKAIHLHQIGNNNAKRTGRYQGS
jgi:branched-chain amino acid transport system permease protein